MRVGRESREGEGGEGEGGEGEWGERVERTCFLLYSASYIHMWCVYTWKYAD